MANGIADSITDREKWLLGNEVMLAAIWIDSRSRVLLTDEQQIQAKSALCALAQRYNNKVSGISDDEVVKVVEEKENSSNKCDDFELYMAELEVAFLYLIFGNKMGTKPKYLNRT